MEVRIYDPATPHKRVIECAEVHQNASGIELRTADGATIERFQTEGFSDAFVVVQGKTVTRHMGSAGDPPDPKGSGPASATIDGQIVQGHVERTT